MTDLADLTTKLGKAYKKWKDGEKEKERLRKQFFDAVTEAAADDLDEKLITVELQDGDTIEAYVERQHPGWSLDEYRVNDKGETEAILIIDPAYKPFTYVNAADGLVYQRQVVSGGQVLDDERLRAEDPDLWLAITEIPDFDAIINILNVTAGDHLFDMEWVDGSLEACVNKCWSGTRTLKKIDDLDPELQTRLRPYVHPGKPVVKFAAPKKATEEQLEEIIDVP